MEFIPGNKVTPLIGADAILRGLADALGRARRCAMLSYWALDPDLPLPDEASRTWGDLLVERAEAGVEIFLCTSDFDPLVAYRLHEAAWRRLERLAELRRCLPEASRERLHMICARNETRTNPLLAMVVQPLLQGRLWRVAHALNKTARAEGDAAAETRFRHLPGLHRRLKRTSGGFRPASFFGYQEPWAGSRHEKSCVVDAGLALVASANLSKKERLGTPWHEVGCLIEGPAAAELHALHAERWVGAAAIHRRVLDEASPEGPIAALAEPPASAPDAGSLPGPAGGGDDEVALLSTEPSTPIAPKRFHLLRRQPTHTGLKEILASARRLVYIETQFLRDRSVAKQLAATAAKVEGLQLLLVLPQTPADLGIEGVKDPITKHGQFLQKRNLRLLRRAFRRRFGLFTLYLEDGEGEQPIYVHSKTVVVDDRYAVIGSANLNGRSLRLDSEQSICWRHRERVATFRRALWRQHLGAALAEEQADNLVDYWIGHTSSPIALRGGGAARLLTTRRATEDANGSPVIADDFA